jgi:hypothetical protein
VLEFLPGGGARLVPVALWIDDRFYDASLYGANPEPMALQPETVYEATDYGEPTGLFTVTTPEQVKGSWVGTGHWKPELPFDKKLAQQAAKQPKPKLIDNPADDRPVLHRAGIKRLIQLRYFQRLGLFAIHIVGWLQFFGQQHSAKSE